MRKFIGVLLSVLCICCAVIGLTGCKKNKHIHAFDKQVITDEYKATDATCTEKATYYYSCECGEKGTETFTSGNALGHSFTNYVSDNNATCTEDGTKTAKCDRCSVTDTIPDENSKLESKMTFKTLTVGEKNTDGNVSVYGKVPNAQKTYSFIDEIKTEGVARFVVSTDVYGMHTVVTKTIPLSEGDNKIFVIELNGEDVKSIYEITIRRRPMYSVVFDTNGGTILDSRQIEEGTVITAPETTKAGYTFIEWDYDFTQPITQNTTIKAIWSANTNTPYKVEYYKENIKDDNYTLCETSDLIGVSDAIASAEQKSYENFTFDENESVPSGAIAGDGSLILKMYYKRNVYAISNANSAYGEITNATTKKYGSNITSVVTEYLGCEFLGWYNGEELLSNEKEYTFTIENNVTAKFKVKDEMSNFNFYSSVDTCKITGLKDKTVSEIIIPDYVTSIGYGAFGGCSGLTSVTIGNGVTSIGSSAFSYCSGLTSITIPNSVTSIGGFSGCSGLTSITIPDSVTSIGDGAFYNCSGLTSITIPDSVTSIGESAFYNCSGLTSITIPDSVTSIGWNAFSNCYKLVEVINKSGLNITKDSSDNGYIAYYALNVKKDGTSDIVNKEGYLFYTYDNVNYLLAYVGSDTDLTLPDGYNGQNYELNNYAFYNCSSLTSVTIPDSVTSIGDWAFRSCSGLTSVTIGNSVTSIGNYSFGYCSGLTSVTIPESVTSIGWNAFSGCSGIESFVVTTGNKKYHSANNCIIETETKKLIIGCKNSVIPTDGSVTSIGDVAFAYCSGLTSVIIPDSVTSIGYEAFYYCSGLTNITIPESVTSIGSWAFGCSKLKNITYTGTIADWKNIAKVINWNYAVPTDCVIHCTDGDIKISD